MKFEEYEYKRIDIEKIKKQFNNYLEDFNKADAIGQIEIIDKVNLIKDDLSTMIDIASIRNTINTCDEFYEKEMDYINEISPILEGLTNSFDKAMVNSKYKKELKDHYGEHLFAMLEASLKTFKDEIVPLLVEENKLVTAYRKLMATLKVTYNGKEYSLTQMAPFFQNTDREERKKAQRAYVEVMALHQDEIDNIYDKMVKNRNEQAIKLGYKNYVEVAYAKLGRTDYDSKMVENYRKQIYESLVPYTISIINDKKERLGLSELKYYDLPLEFIDGNPNPIGSKDELVSKAKDMYSDLSKETNEFFNFMIEHNLLDLEAKHGKAGGGYCTYIPNYKSPFIFANFNGTAGDVDVLTHEAGHAFQVYQSKNIRVPEYRWPTLEACEIHSMSMEFFAYPWMKYFFENEKKYKYSHITGALTFIPYGATVDEFQHYVYENPNVTPLERRKKWREIEKKYLPYKDYDNESFYENGGFWFKQSHIFSEPFYYIDYTLAQVCALQFFIKNVFNHDEAWNDYLELCKKGGSMSFLSLLKIAKIDNPFVDGTIKRVVDNVILQLEKIKEEM